jgi:hypothetical protein
MKPHRPVVWYGDGTPSIAVHIDPATGQWWPVGHSDCAVGAVHVSLNTYLSERAQRGLPKPVAQNLG